MGPEPPATPFLPLAQGHRVAQNRMSLCPAYPTLAHQDVNLKMPRNNQLLHLAFREDKQWKLQQVTQPLPGQGTGHRGRQGQAHTLGLPGAGHGDLWPQPAWKGVA